MNTPRTDQKPGLVTAIAVMTLVSGIINLFWGFVASATVLSTIIGAVCLPIAILPTILGVFEIIYAARLLSVQPQPTQPSSSIAIFQILTFLLGNVFSMVVGILALVFYNDLTVKDYFNRLNNAPVVVPPAPSVSLPEVPSQPVIEETPPAPEKSKRARKTAGK